MNVSKDGPYLVVTCDRFVARLVAPAHDDPEQLDNQDIYVTLHDGPTYYATVLTPDAIGAVLRRWAGTGESAGGRYFYTTDLVIVPRPGLTAMIEGIDGLVREGEIGDACRIVPDPVASDAD